MELTALLGGRRALKRPCQVHVVSDSEHMIDAVGQWWLEKWQAKNWKSVKHPDLCRRPCRWRFTRPDLRAGPAPYGSS
ncbi:RNase H family protein [Deinococcus radiopugnans]|uniref:RNase H family protein n=1 Tax=Deinococcus radiopugnans TaxID=57497 RepID=UPI001FE2282C|nr:RNase H family protein [Deinococcus radiopugnans]